MLKACLLAFASGIFFFFLILQSAWWLVPGILTWTAIFVWQERQERLRDQKEPSQQNADHGAAKVNNKMR
jgi:hypothetical protein